MKLISVVIIAATLAVANCQNSNVDCSYIDSYVPESCRDYVGQDGLISIPDVGVVNLSEK